MLAGNKSLIAAIAVMVIIAIGGFYLLKLKQAPYPVSSFLAVSYRWGTGESLPNSYDSGTGKYQYLDNHDSLQVNRLKLNASNIIFLHNKANEIGLWDLPETIGTKPGKIADVLRYEMEFRYEGKTKRIVYYTNSGQTDLSQKASALQQLIAQTIAEAEARGQGK